MGRSDRPRHPHPTFLVSVNKIPVNNLPISQIGAPVLRQTALDVEFPLSPKIKQLIIDLIHTAELASGVGIAAPQVAAGLNLFILASRPSPRYPHAPTMEPMAIINPQIIDRSSENIEGWEGCLSVPNLRAIVSRAQWVNVEYLNVQGQLQRKHFSDFVARIFQHEYDHLHGVLFVDHVGPKDLISEEEYQKICFDPVARTFANPLPSQEHSVS
jgi:peptide deformylase